MKQLTDSRRNEFIVRITFFTAAIFIAAVLFQGCDKSRPGLNKEDFKTEFQGVLLIGGMAYFGKIEKIGPDFIELTDIFYVQSQQNPETKETQSILVKRGKEFHAPDRMYINRTHVIMIEPVSPDSRMSTMIKELKAKLGQDIKK